MLKDVITVISRPVVRAWAAYSAESWMRLPRPTDEPRVATAGVDPDRIALVGSGPAVGYGVLSHELAFSGHLVRRTAAITGHPTIIEIVADGTMSVSDCRREISGMDLAQVDAIVTTIGVNETFALSSAEKWRRSLTALLDDIERWSPPHVRTFIVGVLPAASIASFPAPIAWLWTRHARALNSITLHECARRESVEYLPFSPAPAPDTTRYRSTETYRSWAELVVGPVAAHLAGNERRSR